MVDVRKLKQALEDHEFNVNNMEIDNIPDSFKRLKIEVIKALESLEFINGEIKVE